MKAAILALMLLLSTAALAESPNPDDYNIAIHVVSSRLILGDHGQSQDLTVVIDGKHYELSGGVAHQDLLRAGDYKAKLLKQDESRAYEYRWVYEFLFSDGKTRAFMVVGEGE